MTKITTQRLQFDILDLMRSVRGFERPDGYAVFPQDVVEKIEEELNRLYQIEEAAAKVLKILQDSSPAEPAIVNLMKFFDVSREDEVS